MSVAMSLNLASGSSFNVVAFVLFALPAAAGFAFTLGGGNPYWTVAGFALGFVFAQAPKVAEQWERAVVFRLGRYTGLRGPGLFWIVPFIETLPATVDQRVVTTGFAAEQTLTADMVPVNVDAGCSGWSTMPRRPRSRSRVTATR